MSDRIKALGDALRIKATMIELGEKIAWGSDVALMREAADALAASHPAQPVAAKVKPLVWIATGDAGDFMAYDPLFERQVLSLDPAAYDTERVDRIMAALDVQPMTVQDAARVLWEAYKGLRDKDWKDCTEAERDIKIMDSAGLRAIAERK